MGPIVLLAGLLLLLYGGSLLGGHTIAATKPSRERSRAYAVICVVLGITLLGWGIVVVLG